MTQIKRGTTPTIRVRMEGIKPEDVKTVEFLIKPFVTDEGHELCTRDDLRRDDMTVKQTQCLLAYLGYYTGQIDGQWGSMSTAACRSFQADYGLTPDGICGTMTQKMLIGAIAGTAAKAERPAEAVQEDTDKPKTGTFWDGIKWFKREEFKCKCGGRYCNGYPAEMQEAVVKIADAARAHFGKPAHVISGLRCQQWNAHEGGVANSQHMYGEAIDLRIDGVDSETLRQFVAKQPGHRYSYRINGTNVHFDIPKVGR